MQIGILLYSSMYDAKTHFFPAKRRALISTLRTCYVGVARQDWKAKGLEVYGVAVDVSTTAGQQALFDSVRVFGEFSRL